LLKARRLQRAALAGSNDSDDGNVAGSSDSDGGDDELEVDEFEVDGDYHGVIIRIVR